MKFGHKSGWIQTWFAWRPVKISGQWYWLTKLQRKKQCHYAAGCRWIYFEGETFSQDQIDSINGAL